MDLQWAWYSDNNSIITYNTHFTFSHQQRKHKKYLKILALSTLPDQAARSIPVLQQPNRPWNSAKALHCIKSDMSNLQPISCMQPVARCALWHCAIMAVALPCPAQHPESNQNISPSLSAAQESHKFGHQCIKSILECKKMSYRLWQWGLWGAETPGT